MLDFIALAAQCAPTVAPQTMAAVVRVESGFNPYAIGVVNGRLTRQPRSRDEAIVTATALESAGWNFSVGVAQINRYNLPKYKLTYDQAFDVCKNLRVGAQILEECFLRALPRVAGDPQAALRAAISCYYSGNFTRGFIADKPGAPSYVSKVLAQAASVLPDSSGSAAPIPVVPAIQPAAAPDKASLPDNGSAVSLRRARTGDSRTQEAVREEAVREDETAAKNPVIVF
jgi:type IV secretion system protein VirB1